MQITFTKPFSLSELTARIHSLIHRYMVLGASPRDPDSVVFGDLAIYPVYMRVTYKGEDIALTGKEYDLKYLIKIRQH